MDYKQQEFDFINRTKEIIKQYDSLVVKNKGIKKDEKYEVTLFINCLVGLLILPEQKWFKRLPLEAISEKEWGISESQVMFIKKGEKKNVKNIARHLRNSVSHYRFKVFRHSSKNIKEINFKDFKKTDRRVLTFESTISIEDLRKFTTKLTEYFLKEMTGASVAVR